MVIVKYANDLNATNHMASNLHGNIVAKFDMYVIVITNVDTSKWFVRYGSKTHNFHQL